MDLRRDRSEEKYDTSTSLTPISYNKLPFTVCPGHTGQSAAMCAILIKKKNNNNNIKTNK